MLVIISIFLAHFSLEFSSLLDRKFLFINRVIFLFIYKPLKKAIAKALKCTYKNIFTIIS